MSIPRTIVDKIWDDHVVQEGQGSPTLLYIDLHLIHEVTSPQAFEGLRRRGIPVRRCELTFATADHSLPTTDGRRFTDPLAEKQIKQLGHNCEEFGIPFHGPGSSHNGIVHVVGPELGLTQPGMTVVCGDSHTATHGAFGALAFGIGTSEVEMVLATQCLLQSKPKAYRVTIEGRLLDGTSAKDVILALIARIGIGGGTGCVFEYSGSTIRCLSMEERMTVCNMSIEAGARAGLVAPDDVTFEYLSGRPRVPRGEAWEEAVTRWKKLESDHGACYQRSVSLDVGRLSPMITFGTHPGMVIPVVEPIPDPHEIADAGERESVSKALRYMGLVPGKPLLGHAIDVVFIGSCTNSRLSDLRAAASVLKGRKISSQVRTLVVPGSQQVKEQAETEGLDRIFLEAGAEWRQPGCSMCIAMNGDELEPGEYCISTSNRNFEGRQGKLGRTFLASPLTAAASAVGGRVTDVRTIL